MGAGAGPAPGMVYTASDASSTAQPYFEPSAQDYQSIVDQIMSQSRKGSDYGLELGDFEMLDTLGEYRRIAANSELYGMS